MLRDGVIFMNVPWLLGSAASFSNETDRLALLHFKDLITDDPHHSLSSWNDTLHICHWQGVTCGRRHPQRVTTLILMGQNLVGSISPYIGNLTFLRRIDLRRNGFHGTIPEEIGRLFRLKLLQLTNNTLTGEIPATLANYSELKGIAFYGNQLIGKVPDELGFLPKLLGLSLTENSLSGRIPPSLGNLSNLIIFILAANNLEGSIPGELSKLVSLDIFGIGSNKLSGKIPPVLYNLSSISTFDVGFNNFHGNLPPNLGLTLPNLEGVYVSGNQFTGPIAVSLSNASGLVRIELSINSFSGSIPINFGSLKGLTRLALADNRLGIGKARDLFFLDSLMNCSSLQVLDVSFNRLSGALPTSMANLSTELMFLSLGHNRIFGSIPSGIQNLFGLTTLSMEWNILTGTIPVGVGKLNKVRILHLNVNELSGRIPSSLSNMSLLYRLVLYGNNLMGTVPSSLENCTNMQFIYLHDNNLSGSLPKQLFSFPSLVELIAGNSSFTGNLPLEAGNMNSLGVLNISYNKLSGEIPSWVATFLSLEYLFLDGNYFQGSIPPSFTALKGLQSLDLSRNNLSGKIPQYLENLYALQYLNLSYNRFEGELPKKGIFGNASGVSVVGNSKLCGGIRELQLPACSNQASKKQGMSLASKVNFLIIGVVLSLISLSCFFATLYWVRKSRRKPFAVPSMEDPFMNISYAELFKATDGFSSVNLIGTGSFGSVYKGTLDRDGIRIAVKVLNLQQRGALRSFMAECEALRNIKHRNLIKILTCCSTGDTQGVAVSGSGGIGTATGALDLEQGWSDLQQEWSDAQGVVGRATGGGRTRSRGLSDRQGVVGRTVERVGGGWIFNRGHSDKQGVAGSATGAVGRAGACLLDNWLHIDGHDQSRRNLNFIQRLNIAVDVVSVLDYLHHHLQTPIVHRDLKPSNILLDDDMIAHVGDFGLAKFLSDVAQTSSLGVKGSIGYIAPEYGMGGEASTQGDVYSYGILLLEMISGKEPTDEMFKDNLSLHHFSKSALPEQVMKIVDPFLLIEARVTEDSGNHTNARLRMRDCLTSMVRIGVLCSLESPTERMKMKDVVVEMHAIKDLYLGVRIQSDKHVKSLQLGEGPSERRNY
ncbi:probable LRR receptor-like serine/threonine-protein kinase At3g47570 [Magnolia sinica]|uniref:probable LRR receptor-like serine/threonine-protein kinase At3g47570 n=1 Tax=Magnolia sinica TaxID=86752 RepID=UPI00265A285B|nr:probable LRR receptor-like serine/threonine-protein kinase At3g47570 [Magnolia sinica]